MKYYKKNKEKTRNTCKELIETYEILTSYSHCEDNYIEKSELFKDIDIEHLRKINNIKLFGNPNFKYEEIKDKKIREQFEFKMKENSKRMFNIKYIYKDCKYMLKKEEKQETLIKEKYNKSKYENECNNNSSFDKANFVTQGFF